MASSYNGEHPWITTEQISTHYSRPAGTITLSWPPYRYLFTFKLFKGEIFLLHFTISLK